MADYRKEDWVVPKSRLKPNNVPQEWAEQLYLIESTHLFQTGDVRRLICGGIRGLECVTGVTNGNTQRFSTSLGKARDWFLSRVIPNTVIISTADPNFFRLLVFALIITYKMHRGKTQMTITEFAARDKRRTMFQVISDQFVGKIGEVGFASFAEKYGYESELNWGITRDRSQFATDLPRERRKEEMTYKLLKARESIKSSKTLEGARAEYLPAEKRPDVTRS